MVSSGSRFWIRHDLCVGVVVIVVVGVMVLVGVRVGVCVLVGVLVGVCVLVGVTLGVGVGVIRIVSVSIHPLAQFG